MHRERLFALTMGVEHFDSYVQHYNAIMEQLTELEKQYRSIDPGLQLAQMWTCQSVKGQVKFSITRRCLDQDLRCRLMDIFESDLVS